MAISFQSKLTAVQKVSVRGRSKLYECCYLFQKQIKKSLIGNFVVAD